MTGKRQGLNPFFCVVPFWGSVLCWITPRRVVWVTHSGVCRITASRSRSMHLWGCIWSSTSRTGSLDTPFLVLTRHSGFPTPVVTSVFPKVTVLLTWPRWTLGLRTDDWKLFLLVFAGSHRAVTIITARPPRLLLPLDFHPSVTPNVPGAEEQNRCQDSVVICWEWVLRTDFSQDRRVKRSLVKVLLLMAPL